MKMDWNRFLEHNINITLYENYGIVPSDKKNPSAPDFYEIVFKTGKLVAVFDDGLLLEALRENQISKIFVPYTSMKCVEIL